MTLLLALVAASIWTLLLIYAGCTAMLIAAVTAGIPYPLPPQTWRREP